MNDLPVRALDKNKVTPKEFIFRHLRYIPWLVVALLLVFSLAYIKLRYSTPIYGVSGKLLVKKGKGYDRGDKFDDIFSTPGGASASNLNDEIELIKSRAIAARVVYTLDLQTRFSNKGKIRTSSLRKTDIPFFLTFLNITDSLRSFGFQVILNENDFRFSESPQTYHYGETVKLPSCSFVLQRKPTNSISNFASNIFTISWTPLENAADALSNSLNVAQVASSASVLNFSYETDNPKLGENIVDAYMQEYINASLEDRKQTAITTLSFIDDQLITLKDDLSGAEKNLLDYRQRYSVFDPEQQSKIFFNKVEEADKIITEQKIKLQVVDYLFDYLNDKSNSFKIVPATLGIDEPALLEQIGEYNKLQQQRAIALKTTTTSNPLILTLETAIEKLRSDMRETLTNIRNAYTLSLNELSKKYTSVNSDISNIPVKQKQLQEVTRQQKILQELYSYLLQKKLETAISSASTISNVKVLDAAKSTGSPISPNRKNVYMLALFLGLVIPIGAIALKEYLNDKVISKSDITKITNTPILGEVGHADNATALVVKQNDRGHVAEQFRIIRSNLQYILPKNDKPVILVTSSFSGEGKSFVSTNLGAVLALSGKKTIILEMDIRKPKILKGLGMEERKGITNYIIGNVNLADIIVKVPDIDNLYVIPCGPVPPNPGEILLDSRVNNLFSELLQEFDAVIIDSAPIGLVSDAVSLGAYSNASVYIVRHNYTLKKQIQFVDSLYNEKKLPHMSIVINDIKSNYGSYYGYGYGYGYGFGMGYGFGNISRRRRQGGYFEGSDKKKKRGRKS